MHLGTICISGLYLLACPPFQGDMPSDYPSRGFVSRWYGIWHPLSGVCIYLHLGTICISGLYLQTFYPLRFKGTCIRATPHGDSPQGNRGLGAPLGGLYIFMHLTHFRHLLMGYGTLSGYAFCMHLGTICISGLYLHTPLPLGRGGGAKPSVKRDVCSIFPVWDTFVGVFSTLYGVCYMHLETICISGLFLRLLLWCNLIALQIWVFHPVCSCSEQLLLMHFGVTILYCRNGYSIQYAVALSRLRSCTSVQHNSTV